MTLPGLDCSHYQGQVDFPAVAAAGYRFAIIAATDGPRYRDPNFAANWQGAKAVGLAVGAYCYLRLSTSTPEADLANFLGYVGPSLAAGDVVALDAEDEPSPSDTADYLPSMLTAQGRINLTLGCEPLLYSRVEYMQRHNLIGNTTLANCGLWIAEWGVSQPTVPAPWQFWALWQTAATGTVPGIQGAVDLDSFNGTDIAQFKAYGLPQPAPKPQMSNNDAVQALRALLVPGGLDPAAADAVLKPFL